MRIHGVDFPSHLIDEHRAGRLVIFVGAGASIDPPSNLPLFDKLTAKIAADAGTTIDDGKHLDAFLGELADRDVDVHARVVKHVNLRDSKPNALHRALADLAIAGGDIRIVTTNYDRHLSTALREREVEVDEYLAPALPVGDDFTGVVYLHGKLDLEARRLVVTDKDFGRAYLTDAWAARTVDPTTRAVSVSRAGSSISYPLTSSRSNGRCARARRRRDPPPTTLSCRNEVSRASRPKSRSPGSRTVSSRRVGGRETC